MKKLTDYQKEFILKFFKNERHFNWKNIAEQLIEKGTCIVAGDRCIWNDGIGNFIKAEPNEDTIGCLVYEFDLKEFLSSEYFKEASNAYISELASKKSELENEYESICDL